jgi:hypothetical protein
LQCATDLRTNPLNFRKKNIELAILKNPFFFKSAILELLHPACDNWLKFLGYQGWVEILMITLVASQKSPIPNISAPSAAVYGQFAVHHSAPQVK